MPALPQSRPVCQPFETLGRRRPPSRATTTRRPKPSSLRHERDRARRRATTRTNAGRDPTTARRARAARASTHVGASPAPRDGPHVHPAVELGDERERVARRREPRLTDRDVVATGDHASRRVGIVERDAPRCATRPTACSGGPTRARPACDRPADHVGIPRVVGVRHPPRPRAAVEVDDGDVAARRHARPRRPPGCRRARRPARRHGRRATGRAPDRRRRGDDEEPAVGGGVDQRVVVDPAVPAAAVGTEGGDRDLGGDGDVGAAAVGGAPPRGRPGRRRRRARPAGCRPATSAPRPGCATAPLRPPRCRHRGPRLRGRRGRPGPCPLTCTFDRIGCRLRDCSAHAVSVRESPHRLVGLPGQPALRRPGGLHPLPRPGADRAGPPGHGVLGPAVPRARRPGAARSRCPSLDLYRPENPFRVPWPWEFKTTIDLREFAIMCSAGFPEPYTFSLRARRLLAATAAPTSTSSTTTSASAPGLLGMMDDGWPVLATLHHPITVDRDLDLEHATSAWRRFTLRRWYGFLEMQMKVARAIPRVVTVSESSKRDIVAQMGVPRRPAAHRARRRRPGRSSARCPTIARVPGRLMTTASADVPMKGLVPLLEALAKVRTERDDAELVVIGKPKGKSKIPALIERLGLTGAVRYVSGRHHRAHRRALRRGRGRGRAVALRGVLAARDRGDGVRRAAGRHHRRRAARGGRHRR